MAALLHLDSSPMGDQSISRNLSREFASLWRNANPQGTVIYRDVTAIDIPAVNADWVGANYTPVELRSPEQRRILELSTLLAQELLDAQEYAFGIPLHNWGPPSSFKLWADQIVCFGKTVQVTSSGLKGMLEGKRLNVFISAGRRYGNGLEDPAKNHLEPWLRTFFEDLGIRDIRVLMVDGTAAIRRGKVDPACFLEPHIRSLRAFFELSSWSAMRM
jgi:FMN-dependent NADH-azoreductase